MKNNTNKTDEEKRLESLFWTATQAKNALKSRKYRKLCEEFYYNDVDSTLSQFDEKQIDAEKATYNIPVSTKFTYAIVEQLLAFLTATKPVPRLISAEESTEDFVEAYQKAYHAVFYESQGSKQIENVIRDSLNTGNGIIYVRQSSYENEATTRVVMEYLNWKHVIVDPESRKWDWSDADYVILADVKRIKKVEEELDVKVRDTDSVDSIGIPNAINLANDFTGLSVSEDKKQKYVWVRKFFELVDKNVYIGNDITTGEAIVSLKRPDSIDIPNPAKEELNGIIIQKGQELAELEAQMSNAIANQEVQGQSIDPVNPETYEAQGGQNVAQSQEIQELTPVIQQMREEIRAMQIQLGQMEDIVPAFEMELESLVNKRQKLKAVSLKIYRNRRKRVKYTLMVGSKRIEKKFLPIDKYPIISFPFSNFNSPNKTFGIIHFIIDIVKAMNKYLSQIMYDIAVNGHRKGFIWEGTILDPDTIETDWSQPGKLIKLKFNPAIPDGGKPMMVEPGGMNQSIQYMIEYFKTLIEYITGIYGVMQGDTSQAPNTLGATQSIQNFGTQRVKLYSRNLEHSFENLAYVIVHYLQAYAPRNKIMKYFDTNGDGQEVQIMNSNEDTKFKVRVDIVSSLPTTKQMTVEKLAFITQTMKDDRLKALMTEEMLKMEDVPEAKEIAEKINIIQQMQQELEQATQQVQELEGKVKAAENNMAQKDIAMNVEKATASAKQSIAVAETKAKGEVEAAYTENEIPEELLNTSLPIGGEENGG